ncbi:hypothetical protein, partial [Bradyrhizobium sp.]|uniref:hypothetical protein n=1 Tax=Bradyrhizobium sp. TaxID=376 RepID=UPI003C73C49A
SQPDRWLMFKAVSFYLTCQESFKWNPRFRRGANAHDYSLGHKTAREYNPPFSPGYPATHQVDAP